MNTEICKIFEIIKIFHIKTWSYRKPEECFSHNVVIRITDKNLEISEVIGKF